MNWQTDFAHRTSLTGNRQPLTFDGQRVYLQRYWHYESQVAAKLNAWPTSVITTEQTRDLTKLLDQLFARDYKDYCRSPCQSDEQLESILCEQLDILMPNQLDGPLFTPWLTQSLPNHHQRNN